MGGTTRGSHKHTTTDPNNNTDPRRTSSDSRERERPQRQSEVHSLVMRRKYVLWRYALVCGSHAGCVSCELVLCLCVARACRHHLSRVQLPLVLFTLLRLLEK